MMDSTTLDLPTVIVIDSSLSTAEMLESKNYKVKSFSDCTAALEFESEDLVIGAVLVNAEMGLDTNKMNVIPTLKQKWPFAPLIAMTEATAAEAASEALACGASDYVVKSIDADSLASRINTRVLEYHKRNAKDSFSIGDIRVDTGHRVISRDDQKRALSPTEMSLLQCLAVAKGTIVNRDVMKKRCWGQSEVSDNALNRKLHEVRRALSSLSQQVSIKTIYGTGFLLEIKGTSI